MLCFNLHIFRKAIERASQNQKVVEILGEPIVRGPWYDASLAVGHRRRSVSCTFPVTGPIGSGTLQLKAIRNGGSCLIIPSATFFSNQFLFSFPLVKFLLWATICLNFYWDFNLNSVCHFRQTGGF